MSTKYRINLTIRIDNIHAEALPGEQDPEDVITRIINEALASIGHGSPESADEAAMILEESKLECPTCQSVADDWAIFWASGDDRYVSANCVTHGKFQIMLTDDD